MDKWKIARRILLPLPGDIIRTISEYEDEKEQKALDKKKIEDFFEGCDNCSSADEAKDVYASYGDVVKIIGTNDQRNVDCLAKLSDLNERFNVPQVGEMRRLWMGAMESSKFKHEYKKGFEKTNDFFLSQSGRSFVDEYEFGKRQFVYFTDNNSELAGCIDKYNHIQWAFSLDKRPSDMKFLPTGHPLPYHLYVAHPVKKGLYIPYELAEDVIFNDKVEDYFILLQALGATRITARSIKGRKISSDCMVNVGINTKGGVRVIEAEGNAHGGFEYASRNEANSSTEWSWEFSPLQKPFVPENLTWLEHEPEWQKMVQARTNGGNATKWTKRISSSESSCINVNTYQDLDSTFKFFLVKAHGDIKTEVKVGRRSDEETIWEISAEFKSLENF